MPGSRVIALVMGFVGLAITAGSAAQAPAAVKAQAPRTLRLYVFDCGLINVNRAGTERYKVTPEEVGETRFSVPCFLVAHPRGTLMWDLYHYPQERTLKRPPPDTEFSVEQSAASRVRIEEYLRKTKTALWIEHDFVANARLKKSPAYYE